MKNSIFVAAIISGLFAFAIGADGQAVFQMTFKATAQSTNGDGNIVSQKVNNTTLIQDALTATGNTNSTKSFSLVYVQSASTDPSTPGDFVEVVDNAGTPVYTNLQFMYDGSFPPALTNATGDQVLIGAQVIPLPLAVGDSLGGATINEKTLKNGKTMINGSFNYTSLRSPGSSVNDQVNVVNGTFSANKLFTPH
jgi:hypothetical protein